MGVIALGVLIAKFAKFNVLHVHDVHDVHDVCIPVSFNIDKPPPSPVLITAVK